VSKERQIKNSFIYLIPIIVGDLLPIITLPIFTRILTKEDYGVFALATIYAVFATGLVNFGLALAYERNFFGYTGNKKAAGLLYSTLIFVSVSFLVYGVTTYIFKEQLSRYIIGSQMYANVLFWTFCARTLASFERYYLTYFKNSENANAFVAYTVYESILVVLFSLFMIVYLRMGVMGLVLGQLFGSSIIFSILVVRFLKVLPFAFDAGALKDSLKISYPLIPRIFFGVANNQFDKYVLQVLNTVGGVGIYSIAQRVSSLIFSYMTALENVFNPQLYKRMFDSKNNRDESIGRYLTPFAYISIAVALLISLFSEEVISILTPRSYHEAIPVITVLSIYYGFSFFGKINGAQIIFMRKTGISSALTLVNIVLNIGLSILLVKKFGVIGAAWGLLASSLISGIFWFMEGQRCYKIKWEYKKIGAIFLIFFTASFLLLIMRYFSAGYMLTLTMKCLAIALYAFLGVKIGVFSRENFALIKKMIPSGKNA
jgi:O-antigen/teichoic acid export membrane protein